MEEQENQDLFESRIDLSQLKATVQDIREEVAKIVVGQKEMVDLLIAAILAEGHVLIEGVPGVAKTLTAKIISRIIDVDFSRIQFTPDLMPSDVLGTSIFNVKTSEFEYKKGPIFSNIVLIDEINRSPAKTQAALFEVMEEKQISMDGEVYQMSQPFMVLATQNPIEQEGTYRLPEAQLDRFLFKIEVDYPNLDDEYQILMGFHERKNKNDLNAISALLSADQIADYRSKIREIKIDSAVLKYIAEIVHQTRNHPSLYLGASPRASIAIMTSAQAMAAMNGRDFVTPDDIKKVTAHVLKHRIMLTPEKEMEGTTPQQVIEDIVESVEIPR